MKALKVLGSILISIVLLVLLFILPLSYICEDLIQDNLIGAALKQSIKEGINKGDNSEVSDKQLELIEDLYEDDRVGDFLTIILEKYSDYSDTGKFEINDKEYDMFLDYIDDHKKDIEELTGEEIDSEYIKKNLSKEEINKAFDDMFKDLDKELDSNTKATDVIVGFNKFISTKYRIALISVILILIGLLMLINWSFIKWMIPTSIPLIIDGIFVMILYGILKFAQGSISGSNESIDFFKDMNFNNILYIGLGMFITGIVLIILYNIFKKKNVNVTNPA